MYHSVARIRQVFNIYSIFTQTDLNILLTPKEEGQRVRLKTFQKFYETLVTSGRIKNMQQIREIAGLKSRSQISRILKGEIPMAHHRLIKVIEYFGFEYDEYVKQFAPHDAQLLKVSEASIPYRSGELEVLRHKVDDIHVMLTALCKQFNVDVRQLKTSKKTQPGEN